MGFLIPALAFCGIAIFGMVMTAILTRIWWPLIAYAGFWAFFFVFFEIRILCSHCPYYAEKSATLHCLANHGIFKVWRYHPEPMNEFEKVSLLVCFGIFGLFPLAAQGYGIWFAASKLSTVGMWPLISMTGITGATLLTLAAFFTVLLTLICPRCVNFSCPFNRVPRELVDEYLRRNQVMRKAWERAGYKLKESPRS